MPKVKDLKNMEVVSEEVTAPEELSPQEKEIIKQQRARALTINTCKNAIDAILKENKCILKVNPNSPIGALQIIIDMQ